MDSFIGVSLMQAGEVDEVVRLARRMMKLVNRASHRGTSPADKLQACDMIEKMAGQEMPSDVIERTWLIPSGQLAKAIADDDSARRQELMAQIAELERQIKAQQEINERLTEALRQRQQEQSQPQERPNEGTDFVAWEHFAAALFANKRRTYGWKTDYVRATHETSNVQAVENQQIQQWQKTGKVPVWAYEQIGRLVFPQRQGKKKQTWTPDDIKYLIDRYLEDPTRSNLELAKMCSVQFGRDITENAVKGQLDRARKKGIIPQYRKDM